MRIPLVLNESAAKDNENKRECGSCSVCCVLPRILATDTALPLLPNGKRGYVSCEYLCNHGCSRYEDRPKVCSDYTCLWRAGVIDGDERRRPDNLGLMFTLEQVDTGYGIEVWELWEGALLDHKCKSMIDTLATKFPIAIRYYGVPCSLVYTGPTQLYVGQELSKYAQTDPKKLGAIIRELLEQGSLQEIPDVPDAMADLEALERGELVKSYYTRK